MRVIELQVSKWGNSLAVRLPAAYAKRAGIKAGDLLALDEAGDGTLSLKPRSVLIVPLSSSGCRN